MKQLQQLVNIRNNSRKLFNKPMIDLRKLADRKELAFEIECSLSPENLYMDGECSHAEAEQRYRFYSMAAKQLMKIDPSLSIFDEYCDEF